MAKSNKIVPTKDIPDHIVKSNTITKGDLVRALHGTVRVTREFAEENIKLESDLKTQQAHIAELQSTLKTHQARIAEQQGAAGATDATIQGPDLHLLHHLRVLLPLLLLVWRQHASREA